MKIGERVRDMIRHWLQIQPATGQNITIRETASFDVNCMRNRVWYRGDASEIEQLFKALGQDAVGCARFWAAAPATSDVRKAHSGIPAILVDTLAYLVKSDLNDVDFESPDGAGVWIIPYQELLGNYNRNAAMRARTALYHTRNCRASIKEAKLLQHTPFSKTKCVPFSALSLYFLRAHSQNGHTALYRLKFPKQ